MTDHDLASRLSAYRDMRERRLVRDELRDAWLVARHADVAEMLRTSAASSQAKARHPFKAGTLAGSLFEAQLETLDAPKHPKLRRAFQAMLAPAFRPALEGLVDRTLGALVDRVRSRLSFDVVTTLAQPMAASVMARCLGLDEEESRAFQADVGELLRFVRKGALEPCDERVAETVAARLVSTAERIVRGAREAAPVSVLCADAVASGEATLAEVASNCVLFVAAGQGPTRDLMTSAIAALLERPALFDRVRAEPETAAAVVEETLRYDAPIQILRRKATAPVRIGETSLEAGATLSLVLGAANHDERVFDAPGEFRLDRKNRHLAFGLGRHHCLGAMIARLSAEAMLRQIVTCSSPLRVVGAPVRYVSLSFSGWHSLVCAWFERGSERGSVTVDRHARATP
jgi:cytochrome P450